MDRIANIVTLVVLVAVTCVLGADRPNIIFILADDLGWNDLSYHGSDQIPTPNIDALAYNGVILNNHYVPPICTPSRSALMTGKYPIHIGMQGYPMFAAEPRGLPLDVKILPEYLKDLGYATKAIGKWHLGYHHKEYTPIYRGFDSHLGYWSGYISYYDYIIQDTYPEGVFSGFDMHRNMSPAYELSGKYATDLFTEEAVRTINRHDQRKPLFMYLAHLAVHAGNTGKLVEAPQDTINKFQHIPDPNRRTYAAMVSRLDDSVGKVVKALQANKMLDNSIIVFMSDNGAPTVGNYANWGSNWPLRGMKITLWEGGVRNAAVVWSPLLQQTPRVSKQMMYMADWLPTLYSAAGGDISDLAYPSDGFDLWSSLVHNEDSPRKEILLNIDEKIRTAAIRKDNWKLIVGASEKGKYDGYFGESGVHVGNPFYNTSAVVNSMAGNAIRDAYYQSLIYHAPTLESDIPYLRQLATTECRDNAFNRPSCEPSKPGVSCLYDINNDPCEKNNLADVYKNVVRYLRKSLVQYRASLVPQRNTKLDPFGADPSKFNNTWVNWMDPEYA